MESKKREHALELHLLTQNLKEDAVTAAATPVHSVIPADTDVSGSLHTNVEELSLDLVLTTNNACVIKGAILFAEHVFEGESLFFHPDEPKSRTAISLRPRTNNAIDMLVKVRFS